VIFKSTQVSQNKLKGLVSLKKIFVFIAVMMLLLVGCSTEDDQSSGRDTETAVKDNDVVSVSDEAIQVDNRTI